MKKQNQSLDAAARVEPATKELEEVATDSAGAITAFINMRERSGFRINSFEQASIGNIILRFLTQAIHNASLGATPPAPGLPDKDAGLANCPFCGSDQWEFYYFSGCVAIRCKNIDCYFHGLPTKPAEAVREIKTDEEIATELETLLIGLHWDTDYGSGMIMKKAVAALREAHQQK